MKRAKLSFSNIILIIACLVVVVSILFLNVINTRNIITLKASIDTLTIENKNIGLFRSTSDELLMAESQLRIHLTIGDSGSRNRFSGHLKSALNHLIQIKTESDSGRARKIVARFNKATSLEEMIKGLGNLSDSIQQTLVKQYSTVNYTPIKKATAEKQLILLAAYNTTLKNLLVDENLFRDQLNTSVFTNAVSGQDSIQKLFWVSLLIILIIVGILLFNVYKMVNYENDILEARERAVKLAQVKSRFLSNMSHEIRSPLTAIMGFTEIIEKVEMDQEKRNFLHAIKTSSEHLLSTVNDVLDFSKLDAGKLKLEHQPFLISNAIEEVSFALATTSAAKKNITIETNINLDKTLIVSGDLFRLKQILYNLLSNAVKFTEEGGVSVTASVSGSTEKSVVVKIVVADTGIGIPNDQLKTVFEEFTQVTTSKTSKETRRSIKGTGLGLSICKLLVELQGGTISVGSVLNQGSVFTFSIPYEIANNMVEKEISTVVSTNDFIATLSGKRALVVEDNEVNVMLITMLLKKVGIIFDVAKDGEKGLELFETNTYDIILTDINVPKLTGDELAKIIRDHADASKSGVPIIGLTATIVQDDLDAYVLAGINTVMVKPFKQDQLYHTIEQYLV